MQEGDWVLATKKSRYPGTLEVFLEQFPIGVGQINRINLDGDIVLQSRTCGYSFAEDDLILLKEKDEV